ncbi:MAG: glycerophosphodiester phosphodiesterase [Azospira oryzae]|jgi:glycerophosphoryl diester phosphodiesterase|nr:MAG: glycerophosphodiester phosphodiesterase [Azospira oryzae]
MKHFFFFLLLCPGLLMAQAQLDKQGHRGSRGLMPENTVPAMIKALQLGVTTLELDVVISKDKHVLVSHDTYMSAEISRKPDGTDVTPDEAKQINLYQMPYAEIKTYDVGSKPHAGFPQQKKRKAYKPLLSELIDSVELYVKKNKLPKPSYNIEIKSQPAGDHISHPEPQEFADLVMSVLKSKKLGKRLTIQSFDVRSLKVMHEKYPEVTLSYLTANTKSLADNLATLGFTPPVYSPYYKTVTAETVKQCHDQRMKIVPWTVNTKEEINQLIALGVDGIITDYPDLF